MHRNRVKTGLTLTIIIVMLFILTLISLIFFAMAGPVNASWHDLYPIPWNDQIFSELSPDAQIFWGERLPKTFLALLAGSGLSLAGLMLQTVFRNPLASPFTLGIAGGASLGAVLYLHLTSVLAISGVFVLHGTLLTFSAFAGALVAMGTVWLLSRTGSAHEGRMLLAGIAVNYFFSSLILFLQYMADPSQTFKMIRWTMGGIDYCSPGTLSIIAFLVLLVFLWLWGHSREMNILLLGRERALSLGVETNRINRQLFLLSSLLTAVLVAVCGPIGFVGLMVPHFARLMTGNIHQYLIPVTFFLGGIFLTVCFTLSRSIIYPGILPVGIITSLLGGPFFLLFLLKTKI